jgi:hypothetical protein
MNQYFANPQAVAQPKQFAIGTAPRVIPTRAPGTQNTTLALSKNIPIGALREGSRLELRLEAFNALNRPQFRGPATTVGAGSFGLVSAQANLPRFVQAGLKLYW